MGNLRNTNTITFSTLRSSAILFSCAASLAGLSPTFCRNKLIDSKAFGRVAPQSLSDVQYFTYCDVWMHYNRELVSNMTEPPLPFKSALKPIHIQKQTRCITARIATMAGHNKTGPTGRGVKESRGVKENSFTPLAHRTFLQRTGRRSRDIQVSHYSLPHNFL